MPSTSRLILHPATPLPPASRTIRLPNRLGLCLLSLASWTLSRMAAAIRNSFDLPADVVESSLKRISAQSGLQGQSQANAVTGMQTQSVRNALEPHHVLDGMLPGMRPGMIQEIKRGSPTVKKIGARMRSSPTFLQRSPAHLGQDRFQASHPANATGMRLL